MRTRYLYLEDGINKIDLMDVGRLVTFALTLEPHHEASVSLGYATALHYYMDKNRDNLLFNCYSLISSDSVGKQLLYTNIELCLLEKSFRDEGASKDSIKAYVTVVNNYHKLLNDNITAYKQKNVCK